MCYLPCHAACRSSHCLVACWSWWSSSPENCPELLKMTIGGMGMEERAKTMEELQASVQKFQPEDFIGNKQDVASKCLEILKTIYDFSKAEEKKTTTLLSDAGSLKKKKKKQQISAIEAPLTNLVTEGFDNEQIWQEVQLQNNFMYENLVSSVSKLLAHQQFIRNVEGSESEGEGSEEDQVEGDGDGGSDESGNEDDYPNELGYTIAKGLFEGNADSEGEEDEQKLSTFEKKKREIEEKIDSIEDEALQPKSWQYQGEVSGPTRPENALLEEHLMFDHLIRQAPEITAETTLRLEDIIKQRIKDQAWDDVERKIKPIEDPHDFKKALVLDAEKSKVGLAELYEQEYLKRKKAEDGEEQEETVPEEEVQIQKDLDALFAKLDALSNFHFTPKAPSAEIKVLTNQPTIAMEEVAPVSASDATLLAPQEIEEEAKGEIKGKAERSDTDRKRERRIKKKKQHLKRLAKEEKAKLKGLGLRNIKLADNINKKSKKLKDAGENNESIQNSKELKSSKAFFNKLQNQVETHIKKVAEKKKADSTGGKISAKRFKL